MRSEFYPVRDLQVQGDGLTVELKQVYVEKKPLVKQPALKEEEVFDEVAESLIVEESLDGQGSDQGS